MNKWLISFCLIFSSWIVQGHQPDLSSTMLVEQKDGNWVLQVRGSLTAFQYEVRNHYGENAYDTPEKFQELVINHLMENLSINFGGQDTAVLQHPFVKLGHETNVVFQVLGVPKTIKSLSVKNSCFKNIQSNQSALLVLKEGFSKEQFVLNNSNEHTVQLTVDGTQFVQYAGINISQSSWMFILLGGVLILGLGVLLKFKAIK